MLLSVTQTPGCSEWKEKLPRRKNSGHFDVTRSINDGKDGDVPHPGSYVTTVQYTVINAVCRWYDNAKCTRIYEAVYFFRWWKHVCAEPVLTLGWTASINTATQRSLAIILAVVRRRSCFSSPAAALVNLQQNSLILQSEIKKPNYQCKTFQLLPPHALSSPVCF